jgi:bifunctional DNA-binding transcriptional regulator/antitoxin component of YhaV-PrlF toxin-antitoxin module
VDGSPPPVIPPKLRQKYGIKAGTRINIIDTGEAILLKPVTDETLECLQARLKGKGPYPNLASLTRMTAWARSATCSLE